MRLAQTSWVAWIEMAQRVGQSHTSEIVTDIKTTRQKPLCCYSQGVTKRDTLNEAYKKD